MVAPALLLRVSQFLGARMQITSELLRVCGGLAALSGLTYAVQMQTDETYRRLFLDELTSQMRQSFADRAAYLATRTRSLPGAAEA